MLTRVRAKEPGTGPITCRSYDLLRDAVRLTRMAPGTVGVLGPAVGVVAQAVAVAITWPEWLRATEPAQAVACGRCGGAAEAGLRSSPEYERQPTGNPFSARRSCLGRALPTFRAAGGGRWCR